MKKVSQLPARITTTDLEAAGIKTSLNQMDVVDILAEECYNGYLAKIEILNENAIALTKAFSDIHGKEADLFKKELGITELVNISRSQKDSNCKKSEQICVSLTQIRVQEGNGNTLQLQNQNCNSLYLPKAKSGNIEYELHYSSQETITKKKGTIEVTETIIRNFMKPIKLPAKAFTDFQKDLEAHNAAVKEFLAPLYLRKDAYYATLSLTNITKSIKNKVNKNIIKSQAPGIQQQLETLFNISL